MLALADPRWSDLSHAYGTAGDTPGLLRQLSECTLPCDGYESEPWFSLWSSLCHQSDVFEASYAAVPHIVEICAKASGPVDFGFFQLPAAIEVARANGKGPAVPAFLERAYRSAIDRLSDCIALHRTDCWDEATLLSALSAQAVAKGHHRIAQAIMNLDDDLIDKLNGVDL